jgi:DNA repair protein RadC
MMVREEAGAPLPNETVALAAHRLFAPLQTAEREVCVVAYMNRLGVLLGSRRVEGAASWVDLAVRVVARDALELDARQVMLAHNHPSGDARPSRGDLSYTRQLSRGLYALDVVLVDHLVIARTTVTSLRAEGLL